MLSEEEDVIGETGNRKQIQSEDMLSEEDVIGERGNRKQIQPEGHFIRGRYNWKGMQSTVDTS